MENGVQIPRIERKAKAQKTTLSEVDRQALYQMAQLPGYRVLLRLMEMECILQDATLMSVDAAEEKRVLAEHRVTLAKWEFFANVQNQVQHEIDELFASAQQDLAPEQAEIARILDATREQE